MKAHNWFDTFRQDLHFTFRQLIQSPGFTLSAVLLLALGIGLNAAMFTLMDRVILRAPPLPDADRLVILVETEPGGCCSPPSWLDQRDIRDRTHAFQSIAATTGGDNVALIREDFWRSVLHGDPNIFEKPVIVNGKNCNVIGIMLGSFHFPVETAVIWTPLVPPPEVAKDRGWHGFPLVARLKTGVTLKQASADGRGGRIYSLRDWTIGDNVRERLLVLQIAALALFLMACANVSSLLLARYSARRRELAIRCALGASRIAAAAAARH